MQTEQAIELNKSSPIPLYFQLAQHWADAIKAGAVLAGDRLPSEEVLSAQLRISRPTVHRAMQQLVDRGLIVQRAGPGTFVIDYPATRPRLPNRSAVDPQT